jgi:Radical SAM superfamily/Iron-sulfur cluster-binding domain
MDINVTGLSGPLPAPLPRERGDVSPALICSQVFDSISIHANGDIVCWCVDVNGQRVYGNVLKDRIADVWDGPAYKEIRDWLLRSRPDSWCPAIDRHCPLRVVPATGGYDRSPLRIKILKLEPVTYCNLQCPVCPVETGFKQVPELRETRAQKQLPLNVMLDVVSQLPDLELIEYFDYGEPFIHRDTVTFLREVRRMRPACRIVTNTNGTVMTPEQIRAIANESLLDRVVFSIDGATTESYRQYRIGGSFSKAFGKMKALADACRIAGTRCKYSPGLPGSVQITWQYILFEWNDGDDELALARQLARSIDVPIEWVITSGYGASKRFLHGSAEAMRLMDPPDSFIHMAANADIDVRLKDRGIDNIYTRDADIDSTNVTNIIALAETRELERDRDSKAGGEAFAAHIVAPPDALPNTRSPLVEWIAGIRRSTRPWRRAMRMGFTRSDAERKSRESGKHEYHNLH